MQALTTVRDEVRADVEDACTLDNLALLEVAETMLAAVCDAEHRENAHASKGPPAESDEQAKACHVCHTRCSTTER
jgi:hypothetical protein